MNLHPTGREASATGSALPGHRGAGPDGAPHILCVGGEDHHLRIPFLTALRRCGFRVSAASSGGGERFARAGLDHHPYAFDRTGRPDRDLAATARLRDMIGDLRPDLVQSFDTKPNILVPVAARRARAASSAPRIVRTINGLGWVYSSSAPTALAARPVYNALQRIAGRSTDATVFQNREDMAFFLRRRLSPQGTNRLIPGSGIDIAGFERRRAAGPTPAQMRRHLGLTHAEIVITVSRLTREKGIRTLLMAAALVHEVRPSVHFLLVGPRASEGPLAVSADEIARYAHCVTALGPRDDIPSLLGMADLFVLPTEYREGVPRVLLEAALAGLPMIATTMPGCTDVVHDGWSGGLVPPRAPGALAARILELLEDGAQAAEMRRRASQLVRDQFGLDRVVAAYADLYGGLLATPGERGSEPWAGDPAARPAPFGLPGVDCGGAHVLDPG